MHSIVSNKCSLLGNINLFALLQYLFRLIGVIYHEIFNFIQLDKSNHLGVLKYSRLLSNLEKLRQFLKNKQLSLFYHANFTFTYTICHIILQHYWAIFNFLFFKNGDTVSNFSICEKRFFSFLYIFIITNCNIGEKDSRLCNTQ